MEVVINHYGHQPDSNTSSRSTPETQRTSATTAQRTPKWDISQVHPLCQYIFSTDASVGENKHIEEFSISQLPDLCLQRIFSFCSPFDFPNLRKISKRFASNSENPILQRALITTTADNLQKMSFFEKLQNNDKEDRKGMAFASAIDNLVNIPGSSMLRDLDNYKIALGNFIQQINWLFKPKHEKTRISQQPAPFQTLVYNLKTSSAGRTLEDRKSSKQWLAQLHVVDAWEVLQEEVHRVPDYHNYHHIVEMSFLDYISRHPANEWHQLALVLILKTLQKIKVERSWSINSEAFEIKLEEVITTTIYAILEAPRQKDVRDLTATLEALYDIQVEPQWKTGLELARQKFLLVIYRNKILHNKSCSGLVLAAVLKTLLKDPFGNTRLLRDAVASTIAAIRRNPNTKTWDRQTLAAVLQGLLKTKPDLTKRDNSLELQECRALIIHEIKTRVTDWDTLILTILMNIAGFETADTGAGQNDLSGQNPKIASGTVSAISRNRIKSRIRPLPDDSASKSLPRKVVKIEPSTISKNSAMAKAHQISAIRQMSAQQTPNGQPALPNHWQDGLVLAVGLEALLAMTVETAANPIWQDDWEMAIKDFIAAIHYTASNYPSSVTLVAALEALNKVPENLRWVEDREQATVRIIDAIRNFHISTPWQGKDFANILQAFNQINTPVSQSLETSLVTARNEIFTSIGHFKVGDQVFSNDLIVGMGCDTMPTLLEALFTPAKFRWRPHLAAAKRAVFRCFQSVVDRGPDNSDRVNAALMALKVFEALPVPEQQELTSARALFIESARRRLAQPSRFF